MTANEILELFEVEYDSWESAPESFRAEVLQGIRDGKAVSFKVGGKLTTMRMDGKRLKVEIVQE
jgi:hypothetical protein